MLYDESNFNQFYIRIANSDAKSIANEILQRSINFQHKMEIEIKQQINFNDKMRIIKENINYYLEYFRLQLFKIANFTNIDFEDNFAFRQEWFGRTTFTCQYFFRQISHKIQWPQLPNYFCDSNNNYIDLP